ncbi:Sarcosine dehydrogenase, mitochondrial [Hondaea fermentalgiana]|uniref:Sarcosine dehydrogenase, mitochondrial n=1 Tax=Hondaea fermentalgiana TaxID=2315210 RepID=A0A2R5GQZ9_9STRA|nr:Sarcosine dehydrogenase, mitochondrial [Hondaea fermentalgiana]|eukprot:GBG33307.1 Sarcosine dehydrogenase, mitochondrial [Hondaea fermentalgiana]
MMNPSFCIDLEGVRHGLTNGVAPEMRLFDLDDDVSLTSQDALVTRKRGAVQCPQFGKESSERLGPPVTVNPSGNLTTPRASRGFFLGSDRHVDLESTRSTWRSEFHRDLNVNPPTKSSCIAPSATIAEDGALGHVLPGVFGKGPDDIKVEDKALLVGALEYDGAEITEVTRVHLEVARIGNIYFSQALVKERIEGRGDDARRNGFEARRGELGGAGGLVAQRALRGNQQVAGFASNAKDIPEEADVVVVGGGSIGSSVLYHLQERGLNAVLLEKDQLTAGTTWHSAGMLWRLRPSDIDVQLHTYTREMCKKLEEETETPSFTENGGLFIATNKERMAEYERLTEIGKYFGIESRVLKPHEIQDVHPLIAVDDVYGGMYSPTDGTIDPSGVVTAYSKAARKRGGRIFEGVGVASIETEQSKTTNSKQVTSVTTTTGHRIKTKWVVNAAGAWANNIAAMVDTKLPLLAMKHAMVVTEKIEGMHPGLPNVRDHDLSIYLKTQGDAMAIGGYEQNPEFWDVVDPSFAFGLFELDWETFGQNLEGHLIRCPAVETAGIKSTVCGPESFTPDHKPLVGPQPGVRGLFNACGFNSMGMMLGGGMGREVATWITEGSPSLDLFSFDCSRFHPETVEDPKWVIDRTHESYAKTYAIVFPHDEALAGRGARKSALYDQLAERGCFFQARHGFERPGWFVPPTDGRKADNAVKPYDYYGAYADGGWRLAPSKRDSPDCPPDIPKNEDNTYLDLVEDELTFYWPKNHEVVGEECRAAREGVAIFDQSYFGKFFLRGPDAKAAVQYMCGADMDKQKLGTVTYTPLCNERGGTEADLTVTCLPDGSGYYFAAGGNTVTKDFEWINRVIEQKGFDCTLTDSSDDYAMISVQGPHSRALLEGLITSNNDLSNKSQPFSTCQELSIGGHDVYCLRLTFVGELGFEIHAPSAYAADVYKLIREAGEKYEAEHGVPVRDAGYRAIDSLSAEKSFRHWHADLSNADTPLEANIGFTVLSKLKREDCPEFIGREALQKQRAEGLQRKLVCLSVDDSNVPLHGMESIWRDGVCMGLVRSTAYGHSVGRSIAYGYVARDAEDGKVTNKWLEAGKWEIGDKGAKHPATFHKSAPFDPTNLRVKGKYDEARAQEAEAAK